MEKEELTLNTQVEPLEEQPKIPLHETVFAWGTLALGFILTHFCVPYFGGLWGGIFWAVFGIFIAVYAHFANHGGVKLTKFHIVMLCVAELFCFTPLFSANRFVCFLASVYSFALYFYLMMCASGADAFGKHFISDILRSVLARPFGKFTRQPVCAISVFKGKGRSKNVLYAFLGLLLALPLTIVVVMLLISSDDKFKNVMNNFGEFLPNLSFSIVWEILFAIPIAMYLFGALISVRDPLPEHFGTPSYRVLPPVISYFAVSPVCVFYLVYVIVQIGNIADAFGKNIGYAEFARQGFFELCAIAVINLGVIVALQTFCKRKENDTKPLALRIYSVIISAFTLMIISTAITKMFMYIGQYGMTTLRVYTSWFMILLAVIFISMIALQIRDYPIWKTLFAAFTVMFAVLCFGNFEGNIAVYNIKAYQSGALNTLDVKQFEELGAAAVSPAYKLYRECGDERLKRELGSFLASERDNDAKDPKFAYFSIPRSTAWQVFAEFNDPGQTARTPNSQSVMSVVVKADCYTAYGIEFEYLLGNRLLGGKGMQPADGSRLRHGEELTFTFTEEDFPDPDLLSSEEFGIRFEVIGKNDVRTQTDVPVLKWNAERGGEYRFVLRENGNGGYSVTPVN